MARWFAIGAVAAAATLVTLGLGGGFVTPGRSAATEAQARSAAVEFFRSQNERRYDATCRLLSRSFIRSHALRDRRTCTAVMRVVFVWSEKIDFRIGRVTREGKRVVVHAVADGSPGRIVLVSEGGEFKILAVSGDQAEP
jgi:hypothetical protein